MKELVEKNLNPLLSNKIAAKISALLKDKFSHIFSLSVTHTFADTLHSKFLACKNIMEYIACYQIVFDKFLSLLNNY